MDVSMADNEEGEEADEEPPIVTSQRQGKVIPLTKQVNPASPKLEEAQETLQVGGSFNDEEGLETTEEWNDNESEDPWECGAPMDESIPDISDPNSSDEKERRFGLHGECGLARIDYEAITCDSSWGVDRIPASQVRAHLREEFLELKDDTRQFLDEQNGKEHEEYIDWAAWNPPQVKLALFRKTAPSCFIKDWESLVSDYMPPEVVGYAKTYPNEHAEWKNIEAAYHLDRHAAS